MLLSSKAEVYSLRCKQIQNNILLFAHKSSIQSIPLGEEPSPNAVIPLGDLHSVVGLDWDGKTNRIFWTDIETKTIHSADWDGNQHSVIVHNNLGNIDV